MEKTSNLPESLTAHEKTSIVRYSAVLTGIHARLTIERYFLDDGKHWNIFKVGAIVCETTWDN